MDLMEKVVAWAKRRGFIFPGSEIYGGLSGTWDYGHYGLLLKNNIKKEWWRKIVEERDDVVGIETAILMNPKTWLASGHLESFTDVLVECKICHLRFREDQIEPAKDHQHQFASPRHFNLLFKTSVGPIEKEGSVAYFRPETAQGIFVNFENILQTTREKIPFGIAQIGKAFRNEITPGNFIFRSREFEQMELEFFTEPGTDPKWHEYWKQERLKWFLDLGIKKENIRLRDYEKSELAHYSKATTDVEYKFPFDWNELEGIANRGDFDLKQHSKYSGKDLNYFPYVIEPSLGVDRAMLAFILDAYAEEEVEKEKRIVLKIHPKLAPYKVAVFPLLANKPKLIDLAKSIYQELKTNFMTAWDDRGNIGKRYRAQDEIGTPFCITVDFDSLEKKDVTVRDRDSMKQERVKIGKLKDYFSEALA